MIHKTSVVIKTPLHFYVHQSSNILYSRTCCCGQDIRGPRIYLQQVRRISLCWQEIRETFSALCFSSSRFAGASSRFDGRDYAADSSRFAECPFYSRISAAAFFGGFRRTAADSHEPAGYSTSWNMRVKQQARNAGLADMEHTDHDVTGGVRKTLPFLDTC